MRGFQSFSKITILEIFLKTLNANIMNHSKIVICKTHVNLKRRMTAENALIAIIIPII